MVIIKEFKEGNGNTMFETEYSFVTREGDDHTSIRLDNGRFENVIYNYGKVTIPQKENEDGTMPFHFEFNILDNANMPREEFDEEFFTIIGDILVDIIENEDYNASDLDYEWTT